MHAHAQELENSRDAALGETAPLRRPLLTGSGRKGGQARAKRELSSFGLRECSYETLQRWMSQKVNGGMRATDRWAAGPAAKWRYGSGAALGRSFAGLARSVVNHGIVLY